MLLVLLSVTSCMLPPVRWAAAFAVQVDVVAGEVGGGQVDRDITRQRCCRRTPLSGWCSWRYRGVPGLDGR